MDWAVTKLKDGPFRSSKAWKPQGLLFGMSLVRRVPKRVRNLHEGGFNENVGNWFGNHHRLLSDLPRIHDGTSLVSDRGQDVLPFAPGFW